MSERNAGLLGCGYQLPRRVRRNNDPVFQCLDTSRNAQGIYQSVLFRDLDRRHCLGPDESITDLVTGSCRRTLDSAGVAAEDVDRLYGYVSVPEYHAPNALYQVHHDLGLGPEAMVVPINTEQANFLSGMVHAAEAVRSGSATYCLVACGSNWSQHIDYSQGHSTCIGDGAGATLIGPSDRFVVIDHGTRANTSYYRAATMATRPLTVHSRRQLPVDGTGMPVPTLELNQSGVEVVSSWIKDGIPELVNRILARHDIRGDQITLITYQSVRILLDHWAERIGPKTYVDTLAEFGHMISATYPVNLAHVFDCVATEYLVIAGVSLGMQLEAVLLQV
ncbi:3-oxoacyl-ACP synthase [Streptomyces sp. L2]|uniref:3-oxoacyl-ACP synthase n=1 Tax=Streptomyces sp. L2 TaxID=2162665 RepID=UPI0010114421|nr:3-oxoacyl-ACP synthase [Streptomyces sp. L2]